MIQNFLKIAWRNLLKNKAFSLINIAGLSIGIAVCFVIMLFVTDELSYDRYNEKADQVVRVVFKSVINGGKINESHVMPPVAAVLKKDYPEVEEATRLRNDGWPKISYNNRNFKDAAAAFVDPNFFSVFSFSFIKGNPKTALIQPNTIVIAEDMAEKYFGKEDPMGKTLVYNKTGLFTVTGIIKKMPANAHFHFDLFSSMESLNQAKSDSWLESEFFTYLVLKKGYDYKQLEAKLPAMAAKYMGPQIAQAMDISIDEFRTKGNQLGFKLQPLTSIHLHSDSSFELSPGGDIKYLYIFGAIAVFMLLIASINFINLSTAGASKRAKEVGIRKVIRLRQMAQLVRQFLLESVLTHRYRIVALPQLCWCSWPCLYSIRTYPENNWYRLVQAFNLLALLLDAGFGSWPCWPVVYPAFFLSSFTPIATLKGKRLSSKYKKSWALEAVL